MPERLPRTVSVGVATIIAALVTGIFTFLAAKQTLRVEVSIPETGKESFSIKEASKRIEMLSRNLTLAEAEISSLRGRLDSKGGADEVVTLRRRIKTLEGQLRSKDALIENLNRAEKVSIDRASKPLPTTVREAPGLRVELLPCRLAGDEFMCEFRATSTDRDKTVYLRSARLIEGNSSEVWPSRMQFASSISEGNHSPGSGKQVYAQMVRGITVGGSVVFAGVNPALATQGIPLIQLKFDGLDAQFRSIHPE